MSDLTLDVSGRDAILQKIAKAEKKLANLLRQKGEVEAKHQSLREFLEKGAHQNIHRPSRVLTHQVSITKIHTPDDKVTLFLCLYRGREDVYPKLWQNQKSGKKGYSPACFNEWVRGACEKPRVKCGECPNQGFLPVTADTVLDHLQGRHIIRRKSKATVRIDQSDQNAGCIPKSRVLQEAESPAVHGTDTPRDLLCRRSRHVHRHSARVSG